MRMVLVLQFRNNFEMNVSSNINVEARISDITKITKLLINVLLPPLQ